MRIVTLEVSAPFRYLWLKEVRGVDLSVHCAKCLLGTYSKAVSSRTEYVEDVPLKDCVHYLCGVSKPYNWSKNFHLAFRPCEGSIVVYSSNGVSVVVQDAERLPIDESWVDESDPNSKKKPYRTCRNWQFANYLAKNPRLLG